MVWQIERLKRIEAYGTNPKLYLFLLVGLLVVLLVRVADLDLSPRLSLVDENRLVGVWRMNDREGRVTVHLAGDRTVAVASDRTSQTGHDESSSNLHALQQTIDLWMLEGAQRWEVEQGELVLSGVMELEQGADDAALPMRLRFRIQEVTDNELVLEKADRTTVRDGLLFSRVQEDIR